MHFVYNYICSYYFVRKLYKIGFHMLSVHPHITSTYSVHITISFDPVRPRSTHVQHMLNNIVLNALINMFIFKIFKP